MKKHHLLPTIFIALFAIAIYFPLFLHLDHMSLRLWDEARRGVNAFEMAQSGNLLVTTYEGKPEMWGTKPPFQIWLQAGLMKLLGYGELALRLPSALAGLATVVLLILFSWRILNKTLAGFLAGLVLLTTPGYVGAHVARSGDFDAMLTLWETVYLLAFFTFICQTDTRKRRKWLYLTAAFVALAGLTKGIAGFLFLPALAVFALIFGVQEGETQPPSKGVVSLLKWKHTWLAALLAFAPLLIFYLLRESFNPGYIATVMDNEVGGRYLVSQGGHLHTWYFYFKLLFEERFVPWLFFLPLGLLVGFWQKGSMSKLTALLILQAVIFLLILSYGKTRIVWYMAPVYPSLALLVGIGFERLIARAGEFGLPLWGMPLGSAEYGMAPPQGRGSNSALFHYSLLACFVIGMFWVPYQSIIKNVYFEKQPPWDWVELKYRDFMRQVADVKRYTIVHPRYNSHVVFYKNVFNLRGYDVRHQVLVDFDRNKFEFGKPPLDFQPEAVLMICEQEVFNALDTVYTYLPFREWDTCRLVKITGRR